MSPFCYENHHTTCGVSSLQKMKRKKGAFMSSNFLKCFDPKVFGFQKSNCSLEEEEKCPKFNISSSFLTASQRLSARGPCNGSSCCCGDFPRIIMDALCDNVSFSFTVVMKSVKSLLYNQNITR